MPLTVTQCKNAKPTAKPYKLADEKGMYLEVAPNGSKYWRLKYRFAGKEKRLALGVFPEVELAEARDKRDAARKLLANNQDPSQAKAETKRLAHLSAENTFEAIAREWQLIRKGGWTERHADYVLKRLEADMFREIGNVPITDITAPRLLAAIRKIEKRGAHEVAHRALQTCGQVFRYAIGTGRGERNPAAELKGTDTLMPVKRTHYAALDASELPDFLKALKENEARLYLQTRYAIELLMLTFVRTGELISAKWNEFDLEGRVWTIPEERMKMGKSHIVPLSKQAVEVLKKLQAINGKRDWVFPNQTDSKKAMSNNTILFALARLGYKGRMTGHGFRALAMSTIKEKLGYRHEVVDRQLAHAPRNKVDAAYDRAKFLPERRKMMQQWADYIDALASGQNVIKAKFGKAKTA
jgi:integrase